MIQVTEPQVWTLIGVFAAALFGMLTLISTLFIQMINAKFARVDEQFKQVGEQIKQVGEQIKALDTKFETRFDHLDRDVRTLFRRVFPEYPDAG